MYLSKNTKILVGVLTLLPLFGIIYYIWWIFSLVNVLATGGSAPSEQQFQMMFGAIAVIGLTALIGLGTLIFYIIHAVKNKNLDNNERIMWVLLFVFISTIAFIIYFILKNWNEPVEKPQEQSSQNFEI